MKQLFFIATLLVFFKHSDAQVAFHASKQSNSHPGTDLNWIGLLETRTELEVLYAFDSCSDQKKLLLKYFNEMPHIQSIKFKIILKYTGYVINAEKTKTIAANEIIVGDCTMTDNNMFVLIPPQWKLDKVTVSTELIEVTQR